MDYIIVKEAARIWDISTRAVTYHMVAGRVLGAVKAADLWLLPKDAKRPRDNRRHLKKESEAQ